MRRGQKGLRLRWGFLAALALLCVGLYDPSKYENTSGDTISSRYWPIAILKFHSFDINFVKADLQGVTFAAITMPQGDMLPATDLGMALFTVPFYAVMDLLNVGGKAWDHERVCYVSHWNGIFTATLAVLALFLLLVKFVPDGIAFASASLFAFGTYNWSLGSQGLSTQTPAVLCHIGSLFLLWELCKPVKGKNKKGEQLGTAFALGMLCAVTWSIRPSALFMIIAPLWVLRTFRRIAVFAVGYMLVLLPTIWIYKEMYGEFLGWRGVVAKLTSGSTSAFLSHGNAFKGLAGILVSPNRGAIVFFPLLLLVPYLWYKLMPPIGKPRSQAAIPQSFSLVLALSGTFYLLATAQLPEWHSSWGYGSRYLYDLHPYVWPAITLGLFEIWKRLKDSKSLLPSWAMALFLFCATEGIFIHALGHRNFDIYVWNFGGDITESRIWDFQELMIEDTWNKGSNRHRWKNAYQRLLDFGF